MKKRSLSALISIISFAFWCVSFAYSDSENVLPSRAVAESGSEQSRLVVAQQQPPPSGRAAPPPAEGIGAGEWVEVPGQWIGGTWVPPHKAWVPANTPPPPPTTGAQTGPPPASPPPQGYTPKAPPGYGPVEPEADYGPPPPSYAFSAAPDVVPVPGTYVYFVPNIGPEILFYHGYWYRPFRGYWYRGLSYNGPWVYLPPRSVPRPLILLPPGYRRGPYRYHPVPHGELRRNWERWERERHWSHH